MKNAAIKEFLRPTWKKFSIFLVFLVVYTSLILAIALAYGSSCLAVSGLCISDLTKVYRGAVIDKNYDANAIDQTYTSFIKSMKESGLSLQKFAESLQPPILFLSLGLDLLYSAYTIIILFLYWYLLACVIVFAFDKLTSTKKKKRRK